MDDQRRYFRIDDRIILTVAPLSEDEAAARIKQMREGIEDLPDDEPTLLALDTEINSVLADLRLQQPALARGLELLDSKFRYLLRHIDIPNVERGQQLSERKSQEVNLSACGISFNTGEDYQLQQKLLLDMVLLPSYLSLKLVATIVKTEIVTPAPDQQSLHHICTDFDYVSEDDEERLIRHILRRQAESLQAKRNA